MTDCHAFRKGGENYLFFPRSARFYELSEAAALLWPAIAAGTEPTTSPGGGAALIDPPFDLPVGRELQELLRHELQIPRPEELPDAAPTGNALHTFSIYLAHACNMSCCYCWNRGGSFGKTASLMGAEEVQRVVSLILSLSRNSQHKDIAISLYGGEPLLNTAALRTITLELRREGPRLGKTFRFTIDTNGSLLQGKAARFLARHFTHVGVSLDGGEKVHDRQRPGKRGEATWQRIVENIRRFPAPRLLGLRATLTNQSESYLETFRRLTGVGVRRIQLEYCHERGNHQAPDHQALVVPLKRQLAELQEFVDYYVDFISRYPTPSAIPFLSDLLEKICRIRRGQRFTRPCGAGVNALAIDCRGELFPCVAFVGRQDFKMEAPSPAGGVSRQEPLPDVRMQVRHPCHHCWLRYDCAGGCFAAHYDLTGNPFTPHPDYCTGMRAKAEVYLYAMARMLKKCPWHLESQPSEVGCGSEMDGDGSDVIDDVVEDGAEMQGTSG